MLRALNKIQRRKKMWSLLRGNQSSGERPAGGSQYDVDGGRRETGGHGEEGRALAPGYSARGFWDFVAAGLGLEG